MKSKRLWKFHWFLLMTALLSSMFCSQSETRAELFPAILPGNHGQNYLQTETTGLSSPGVPVPQWGAFDPIQAQAPEQPAGWPGQEVADYYYIDNTHVSATNSSNPYGTPDRPRLTIPEISYAAGSYVEIHGGPYTGGGQLFITSQGTEENPVWFRGPGPDARPIIRGETIFKGGYIIVENLKYDTSRKTIGLRPHQNSSIHHVVVRHSVFEGPGNLNDSGSVIAVSGQLETPTHDIVVYNNVIHKFGNKFSMEQTDYHGIGVPVHANNIWVLNNHIYDMGGDSIQIGTANTNDVNRVHHIYVAGNEFHGSRENAVDIKEANDVLISGNLMYDLKPSSSAEGAVVVIHDDPNRVWIINNIIHSGVYGIITTGSRESWFIGNLIYNIHHRATDTNWNPTSLYATGAAIHFRKGSTTGGAINNTIVDYDIGIQLTQGTQGYRLSGNILYDRAEPTGIDINAQQSDLMANSRLDFNLIYPASGQSARLYWGNQINTLAEFQARGQCLNCLGVDPLLLPDYNLSDSSPARDGGGDFADIFALFTGLYPAPIDEDLYGGERIVGDTIDIGALEFQGSTTPPPTPDFKITWTETGTPGQIQIAGREFLTVASTVSGHTQATAAAIETPIFELGTGVVRYLASSQYVFVDDDPNSSVDTGYGLMAYADDNKISIPLKSDGVTRTATFFVKAGLWSDTSGSFQIRAGSVQETIHITNLRVWKHYQIQLEFNADVDVELQPLNSHGSYSAFAIAGIFLDETR